MLTDVSIKWGMSGSVFPQSALVTISQWDSRRIWSIDSKDFSTLQAESEKPAEIEKPVETEKPAKIEEPAEIEKPVETPPAQPQTEEVEATPQPAKELEVESKETEEVSQDTEESSMDIENSDGVEVGIDSKFVFRTTTLVGLWSG